MHYHTQNLTCGKTGNNQKYSILTTKIKRRTKFPPSSLPLRKHVSVKIASVWGMHIMHVRE